LFLSGHFGNNAGNGGLDILADILSKIWLVEMLLQHFHYLFYAELTCHLTVVGFPNHLCPLALWNIDMAQ
jgi:hypothetical protein